MSTAKRILINLSRQSLTLYQGDELLHSYSISSASNGPGEELGSGCTPRGLHSIRIKIGAGQPVNAVFVGRRSRGEIYTPELERANPGRDWILTRILWLTGLEPGRNRGGTKDTLRRFIYIHGCPDRAPMGEPHSHGCIRMHNHDVLDLFERVETNTRVMIT